jgi:hypothetical protein
MASARSHKPPVSKTRPGVGLSMPRAPSAEQATFDRLRMILLRNASGLFTKRDSPGDVYVVSRKPYEGKELMFASVQARKSYISYHLFPVYMNPALLEGMSPALERRMQGKSCFNFTHVDETLFDELTRLTQRGLQDWKEKGLL